MDLESALISKIGTKDDLLKLMDEQITVSFFELHGNIYKEILGHYKSYGVVPERETLCAVFPDFKFTESNEPLDFFIDAIKKRHKKNIYNQGLAEIIQLMKTDVEAAEIKMQQTLRKSQNEISTGVDVDIRTSGDSRKEDYLSKKDFAGVDGISSGWDGLDNLTCGFHPGELFCLIGIPKSGKSWLLSKIAHHVWWEERKPTVVLTREMSPGQMRKRFDAIHCGISYNSLRKGLLTKSEEERYFQYLDEIKDDPVPFVFLGYSLTDSASPTVSSIVPKVERYLLDGGMLFVDGIYMLDDDQGESDWRGITNVSKDLKGLSQRYDIATFVTTQAQIQGKGYIPDMENIAYGKYIAQYVDGLLSTSRSPEDRLAEMAWVHMLAQREGEVGDFPINFAFDPIDFSQKAVKTVEQDDYENYEM
jgi:KaiC/GvpD/RAD55 family RecA-like ATPase